MNKRKRTEEKCERKQEENVIAQAQEGNLFSDERGKCILLLEKLYRKA